MSSRRRLAAVVLAFTATALNAACGKEDASSSSSGSTPAATATAAHPTATTAAAPPATATAAPAKGGACSFTGGWSGTYPPGPYPFSGTPFELTFNADGTGITKSQRADQEFAWKQEAGGVFTIHGIKVERGGRFTCSKDEVGRYGYTFTPDCSSVSFKLTQDGCKGRSKTMDGISIKRK